MLVKTLEVLKKNVQYIVIKILEGKNTLVSVLKEMLIKNGKKEKCQ